MNEMMKKKLAPDLQAMIENQTLPDPVSVIVQLQGEGEQEVRLSDADRQMIENVGGQILDDLWIIKGYSAEVPARALEMLVLSPRVAHVHHNSDMTGG
ncbi:MAG: hypothetical protein WC314_00370 [Vulcanimicrobiota bacterium]